MAELLEHEKLAQVQNYAQANDIPSRAVPPRSGLNILTPSRTEPALGATGGKAYGLAAAAKPTAGASPRRGAPPLPAEGISRAGEAASPRNLSRAASAHALTALENSIDRSPRPRPAAPPPSKAPSPVLQPKKTPDWRALPSALDIAAALAGGATSARRQLVVFLDYDGTLTPIVKDPAAATLSEAMRDAVKSLAAKSTVAVVSGRAREKIREFVRLEELYYAGSHGFDIDGPGGLRHSVSAEIIPVLAAARDALRRSLAHVAGASVEDNRFAVSVHWRNVADAERPAVSAVVDRAGHARELQRLLSRPVSTRFGWSLDERSSLGPVSKRGRLFRNARARNARVEATSNVPPRSSTRCSARRPSRARSSGPRASASTSSSPTCAGTRARPCSTSWSSSGAARCRSRSTARTRPKLSTSRTLDGRRSAASTAAWTRIPL